MSENATLEFKRLDKPERKRTYVFPAGEVSFENVTAVCVRPSGSHRLELASGEKVIVQAGWLAIRPDMDAWSF